MVELITRMVAPSITRVTGVHFYAQMLPGRCLIAQWCEPYPCAGREGNEFVVSSHTDGEVNGPRMRSRMLKATIDKGESANPRSDYDGNYAAEIVPARGLWLTQRKVTEA
jgi:hypothetical protein